MKKFFIVSFFISIAFLLMGCPSDDTPTATPPRPYADVYPEDITEIEDFLDTHYITYDTNFNVTFHEIEEGGTETPIANMPELLYKDVNLHKITYKLYYLNLRQGVNEQPSRVDSVYVSYRGELLNGTKVDEAITPTWFKLDEVIRGWSEMMPKFRSGSIPGYSDFGVGVMFLPSGLAYYNSATGNIPSYSPLIFKFNLYHLRYRDHDFDKILSKYEVGGDSDFIDTNDDGLPEFKDSDDDNIPDYLDVDDDGDGKLTKGEIETSTGSGIYFSWDNIPDCANDVTNPNRIRRHLDSSCR